MCGIVGRVSPAPVGELEIRRMCDAIRHRGPDDWGVFTENGTGLGARRLSIIDIAGGHQPLSNEDGRVGVVFNGEIYNYPELRPELEAQAIASAPALTPRSWSISTRSTAKACARGCGDVRLRDLGPERRRLLLARDHFGQKPLFYTESQGRLTFASEVKALLADDPSLAELSPRALDQYLTLRFVQPPETFFPRIRALPPAHYMVWEDGRARIERYWQLTYGPKWSEGEAELLERTDALLAETVTAAPAERRARRRVPQRRARLHPGGVLRRPRTGHRAAHLLHGHSVPGSERAAGGRGRRG